VGIASAASPSELVGAADAPPIGGLSTGPQRVLGATGYPPAVRSERIRAGQRFARLLVAPLAVAAVLSACSADEPQPSAELPPASSSAAQSTPELPPLGPEDLPMPAEARAKDEAGAEAFLRYYMDVYNHAQRTMDSTYMREFSSGCRTCDRISDDLDMDAKEGYEYSGGAVRLESMSKPAVKGGEAQYAFTFTQDALSVTDQGRPVDGLTFPSVDSNGEGAIAHWDAERVTWVLTQWDTV
jgi:hypothetical protein